METAIFYWFGIVASLVALCLFTWVAGILVKHTVGRILKATRLLRPAKGFTWSRTDNGQLVKLYFRGIQIGQSAFGVVVSERENIQEESEKVA